MLSHSVENLHLQFAEPPTWHGLHLQPLTNSSRRCFVGDVVLSDIFGVPQNRLND